MEGYTDFLKKRTPTDIKGRERGIWGCQSINMETAVHGVEFLEKAEYLQEPTTENMSGKTNMPEQRCT